MLFPIGIQDFGCLRQGGYAYVDKTGFIYDLAHTGKYYFLGRPRRFGKSLLISTMVAYFTGQKELFEGLALERLEQTWEKYPVLHLDLNIGNYKVEGTLEAVLNQALNRWEHLYGAADDEPTLEQRFAGVIERAHTTTGKPVVVLIDEYDKPLLQTLDDEKRQDKLRAILKAFYSVLKTQDRHIRFAFLTGVTKFGKVSIFSDLNNLKDISLSPKYATICGITEAEMYEHFAERIHDLGKAHSLTDEETCARLRKKYDGYHFGLNVPGVYNPFSLLNALQDRNFNDYWFETGTPSFLIRLLKDTDFDLNRLQRGSVRASVLSDIDNRRTPIPMFYQSGYLTISDYDREFDAYVLDFPNQEVEAGFIHYILPIYLPDEMDEPSFAISRFVREVRQGHAEAFMQLLTTFFEDCNYQVAGKMEVYFQNALYIVFKMMGFYVQVERATARGRIDVVVTTKDYIYVIECKLDKPAAEALQQINEKGYALPYACDGRTLYKIGISFSSQTRGIAEYIVEEE